MRTIKSIPKTLTALVTLVVIEYLIFIFSGGRFLWLYKIGNSVMFLICCAVVSSFCLIFYYKFFANDDDRNEILKFFVTLVVLASLIITFASIIRKFDPNSLGTISWILDAGISGLFVLIVYLCAYFKKEDDKEVLFSSN